MQARCSKIWVSLAVFSSPQKLAGRAFSCIVTALTGQTQEQRGAFKLRSCASDDLRRMAVSGCETLSESVAHPNFGCSSGCGTQFPWLIPRGHFERAISRLGDSSAFRGMCVRPECPIGLVSFELAECLMGLVSFVSLEPECVESVSSVPSVPWKCRVSESRVSHVSSVHRLEFSQRDLCIDSSVECLVGLVSFECADCSKCASEVSSV